MLLVGGFVLQHVVARGVSAIGALLAGKAQEVVLATERREWLTKFIQECVLRFALVAQQGLYRPALVEYLILALFEERTKIVEHLIVSLLPQIGQLTLGEVDRWH